MVKVGFPTFHGGCLSVVVFKPMPNKMIDAQRFFPLDCSLYLHTLLPNFDSFL